MAIFIGTPNNDLKVGQNWDAMAGREGNDKLNDTAESGVFADVIDGEFGDDYLCFSGTAAGEIDGSQGNDFIKGAAGADRLSGNAGNDVVLGQNGDDKILSGNLVSVDAGSDLL